MSPKVRPDATCVLALADLLAYDSHSDSSLDDASNWLGTFLSEVLLEVAANGPEWANAHPEFVKLEFDKAIEKPAQRVATLPQDRIEDAAVRAGRDREVARARGTVNERRNDTHAQNEIE
jgi:hypothetical protein